MAFWKANICMWKMTQSWDIIRCDCWLGTDTNNQGYADISLGLDYTHVGKRRRQKVKKFQGNENQYQIKNQQKKKEPKPKEIGL